MNQKQPDGQDAEEEAENMARRLGGDAIVLPRSMEIPLHATLVKQLPAQSQ